MATNSFTAQCSCKHEQQDKIHGKGNRVFNWSFKGDAGRCTVCGSSVSRKKESQQTAAPQPAAVKQA